MVAPHAGSAELPGLFERYLLDLDDGDDAAIEARMTEVKRYWDKKSTHPKYGTTIETLRERHGEALLSLGDARERAKVVDEAREGQRQAAEGARRAVEDWDRVVAQLAAAGGLDPARRAQLEKLADRAGIPRETARAKLDAVPAAPEPELLDASQRSVIAAALAALARDLREPRVRLSLFHAFGLDLDAGREAIAARWRERSEASRRDSHGSAKANWDRVLALAKIHLLDNDPRGYVHGLSLEIREALEPEAIKAVADDGQIDEVEAEHLQRQAVALGLTPELAQQAIAELARENGAVVRSGGTVDVVACPNCNRPHSRGGDDERCQSCGTALFIACPGCGRRNDATAASCGGCGTDLHRHAAAIRALAKLGALLEEGRVGQAREDLEEATRVLGPAAPEVAAASREVTPAVEAAKRSWAEVEAATAERRPYAARRLLIELGRTAADFPGPGGDLPASARAAAEGQIAEAEELLARATGLSGQERERALVAALGAAADCERAERELDKLPPASPGAVAAEPSGARMTIGWEPSVTEGARYAVTRVSAAGGGEILVGETDRPRIEDPKAVAGAVVRYSVAAVRGRARSAAATSEPALVALEVADFALVAGDGEARLSWRPHGGAGRVLVERRDESDGTETALTPDAAGLTDRSVVNGRRYTYRVRVEYPRPGGEALRTPGATAFAEPVERPRPLRDLVVRSDAGAVSIDFQPPASGTVVVVKCREDPALEVGADLDPARLSALGESLPVSGATATDGDPPPGRCFYQPLTLAGATAIVGEPARHVALPEIANVRALANGRRAQVTWQWPEGVTLARVAWRHDRQPVGTEDPKATGVDYRLGEYRDRGGCSLDLGEQSSIFVAVYPALRVEGEIVYGSAAGKGARATLRSERKTEVRYSVRRAGRLQKRLEIEVSEPAEGVLPELVLVGREGDILPRAVSDGTVLARLGGDGGPRASSLELRGLARPLAVRLFLDSAGAGGSHVLFDPMADELLIG
ncbi:MAG TPA: zinc ribbon domain-containing protein [Solirubrobacterales bacterium]|nr:zinc ribbon domain-containing protein [Solirubrobacterales bacterium]